MLAYARSQHSISFVLTLMMSKNAFIHQNYDSWRGDVIYVTIYVYVFPSLSIYLNRIPFQPSTYYKRNSVCLYRIYFVSKLLRKSRCRFSYPVPEQTRKEALKRKILFSRMMMIVMLYLQVKHFSFFQIQLPQYLMYVWFNNIWINNIILI